MDKVHYTFLILWVGTLVFSIVYRETPQDTPVNETLWLQELSRGDSLVMAGDYDSARSYFMSLENKYPDHVVAHRELEHIDEMEKAYAELIQEKAEHIREREEWEERAQAQDDKPEFESDEDVPPPPSLNLKDDPIADLEDPTASTGMLALTNPDGAEIQYIGEIHEGEAHGYGFAVFEKKGFYKGEWSHNMRHGEGTYFWQNGDIYEGHYEKGKRSGFGIYYFESGEIYRGQWKDNLRHGDGTLYDAEGDILAEGPWEKDEPND